MGDVVTALLPSDHRQPQIKAATLKAATQQQKMQQEREFWLICQARTLTEHLPPDLDEAIKTLRYAEILFRKMHEMAISIVPL